MAQLLKLSSEAAGAVPFKSAAEMKEAHLKGPGGVKPIAVARMAEVLSFEVGLLKSFGRSMCFRAVIRPHSVPNLQP